ncbi:thiamine-phosphate kinase [Gleimia hominis]|uniref:thiamine-phosphate kinase n=1 Tax=Gleimia hominis TaxID=595468 RepID=UPI001E595D35|nr:thiamine-phosphate kinase [Gleimia hominis]WIK65218.1 thiamine-phosphate kinase [Gleimia hominis]
MGQEQEAQMGHEDTLIAAMRRHLPVGERTLIGSGDDCASIAAPEQRFIVTTDAIVENEHFTLEWSSFHDVGRRAAAQNLADIAAQGGRASALVVALVIPPHVSDEQVVDLVNGFGQEVSRTRAGVVGGDVTAGSQLVVSVTALGYTPYGDVQRGNAQVGDVVAICGTLGFSLVGYQLLNTGQVPGSLRTSEVQPALAPYVDTYRAPHPPYEAGVLAAQAGAHAMMDISDGLSTDAKRMADASAVTLAFVGTHLRGFSRQLKPGAEAAGVDPWECVLNGGEDHSLLACFPPETTLPDGFQVVGRVEESTEENAEGGAVTLDGRPVVEAGWDHLSER